ncbi:nucleoside-diphosphate kinase [Streptococcus halichoeri]|uniref:nucleoside-diphosphate kinase n=1 Tax=Streptococcus halichoeri TaxID=254785 RepID=UPI00135CD84C|nr:nucleoside-diphosphate kinase [Streptococcus halichoeri]
MERTFFMIKPDGVRRGLVGDILKRIEQRGLRIEALEMRQADQAILQAHYEHLVDKPFFPAVLDYMSDGPLIIGILSGPEAVSVWRSMMGATNPKDALPGTIRGDFALPPQPNQPMQNVVHGSDAVSSAQRECQLWFGQSR